MIVLDDSTVECLRSATQFGFAFQYSYDAPAFVS
jgi:hypothetical protein